MRRILGQRRHKSVPAKNNIGILTGGGDVPGLNPVIKSVVYRASELGRQVIGIRKGWEGLTHMDPSHVADPVYIRPLNRENTRAIRSEEHTSELQSPCNLVCRLLLEKN